MIKLVEVDLTMSYAGGIILTSVDLALGFVVKLYTQTS